MKNLPFVIWMLGYPLVDLASCYVYEVILKRTYSPGVKLAGNLIQLVTWVIVGIFLYET